MSHTPGPWEASHREDSSGISYVTADTRHIEVAVSYSRNHADAHLIAAAPELLELARNVAEHFADTDAPLGAVALAAIAKAEGRQP